MTRQFTINDLLPLHIVEQSIRYEKQIYADMEQERINRLYAQTMCEPQAFRDTGKVLRNGFMMRVLNGSVHG